MIKIAFSGIPCTGKTTTARAFTLASRAVQGIDTVELVNEYARTYISENKSIEEIWEQYHIINKQLQWENSLPESLNLAVTDSPFQLAFLYTCDLYSATAKNNIVMTDVFKIILDANLNSPYDIVFHLPAFGIDPEQDGIRPSLHLNNDWRQESDEFLKSAFKIFKPKQFVIVNEKSVEDRVAFCIEKLKEIL